MEEMKEFTQEQIQELLDHQQQADEHNEGFASGFNAAIEFVNSEIDSLVEEQEHRLAVRGLNPMPKFSATKQIEALTGLKEEINPDE